MRCAKCGYHHHEGDSIFYPAYVEAYVAYVKHTLKNILKFAIIEDIAVKEFRLRSETLYSSITKVAATPLPRDNQFDSQQLSTRESLKLALGRHSIKGFDQEAQCPFRKNR